MRPCAPRPPYLCNHTAAINSSDVCAAAAGTWAPASCAISQAPACATVPGASWAPRRMWGLSGGLDLALVGLLQVCVQAQQAR